MTPRMRLLGLQRPDWMADALCAGHPDPELWTGEYDRDRVAQAAAICARCPCQDPCDQWARSVPPRDRWGVFGGRNWRGGSAPSIREPGKCRQGHLRDDSTQHYCPGCEDLVRDAADAMGVQTSEYVRAFGRSGTVAAKVLRELGAEK